MNPRISLTRAQVLRMLDGYPVQVATEIGMLDFDAAGQDVWQPLARMEVTPGIVSAHHRMNQIPPTSIWFNDTYEVFPFDLPGDCTHLSIKRYDRAAIRNWRHLQQIKNEICGPEREALEIFPRESRLADNANQLHLWVLPEDMDIPFGFPGGMVTIDADEVARFNANGDRGRQEPRQEGLTVGDTMASAPMLDAEGETMRQAILDGSFLQ